MNQPKKSSSIFSLIFLAILITIFTYSCSKEGGKPTTNSKNHKCNKPKVKPSIPHPRPNKISIAEKPIIYLYPQQETMVTVKFAVKNSLSVTHSYPSYPKGGWIVKAKPTGKLYHPLTKLNYYALYYEANINLKPDMSKGFVVKGKNSVKFLNKILPKIGLTRREANEFIIYWLPKLQQSKYNLIHFSQKLWTKLVPLKITPKPTTSIRFMMFYSPLKKFKKVTPQKFITPKRVGFVLVEWGGSIYSKSIIQSLH
jgi:hypothetical protein